MGTTVAVIQKDGSVNIAATKGELEELLGVEPAGMSGLSAASNLGACDLMETAEAAGRQLLLGMSQYGCDYAMVLNGVDV